MGKKFLVALLCLGLMVAIYFLASRPTSPTSPAKPVIPTTSLEEKVCAKLSEQNGDCKKILLYDADSSLVFAENSWGIIPVLTNKELTEIKKFIPALDFQEFREEKEENGPITWRVENVQKDFSIIYGFARHNAKTIIINSEGDIQPNRFYIREDLAGMSGGPGKGALWLWYVTVHKDKVKLPVKVTVYDAKGQIISKEYEEE